MLKGSSGGHLAHPSLQAGPASEYQRTGASLFCLLQDKSCFVSLPSNWNSVCCFERNETFLCLSIIFLNSWDTVVWCCCFRQSCLVLLCVTHLLHEKSLLSNVADYYMKINSTISKIFVHPLGWLGNSLAEKSPMDFFLSKNIIPVVSSSPGHFLMFLIVKSVDSMNWVVVLSGSGQKCWAVCSGIGFQEKFWEKKLPLCLRVHADSLVEDVSYPSPKQSSVFALKC